MGSKALKDEKKQLAERELKRELERKTAVNDRRFGILLVSNS